MGVLSRLPKSMVAPYAEWRAGGIQDPVEKLRFLRATMSAAGTQPLLSRTNVGTLATAVLLLVPASTVTDAKYESLPRAAAPPVIEAAAEAASGRVWVVEKKDGHEIYSNGLQIETRYATRNRPRSYQRLDPASNFEFSAESRSEPAGIVFHTTESELAPFEPGYNRALVRLGEELILYIRHHHAYHYLIDRFGRVFRVVEESDTANHAGHSAWIDEHWAYLNLNHVFLGIAFEAQSAAADTDESRVTEAQIHSARILTAMLRSRYGIPAANCVTHAQVSVNPSNMRIGYHTDWAANFPFRAMGLPDNYARPLPSVLAFGFQYDSVFVKLMGEHAWPGLQAAEGAVESAAEAAHVTTQQYRVRLKRRYRERLAAIEQKRAAEEMKN